MTQEPGTGGGTAYAASRTGGPSSGMYPAPDAPFQLYGLGTAEAGAICAASRTGGPGSGMYPAPDAAEVLIHTDAAVPGTELATSRTGRPEPVPTDEAASSTGGNTPRGYAV